MFTLSQEREYGLMQPHFEASMNQMEQRLQAQINMKMDAITAMLERISKSATVERHSDSEKANGDFQEKVEEKFQTIDNKLASIAGAVGVELKASAGDDDEDRKRLKEKLKEALKNDKKHPRRTDVEKEPWMEYIFGICKSDGRVGKKGSRYGQENASVISVFRGDFTRWLEG